VSADASASQAPEISVVVATRDRADRLERLLDGVRGQSLDRERFEVVVVDDASSDGTPAVLEREDARGELALAVLRRPKRGGWAAAREQGWRAGSAPVVAFTDDDCVPDPTWLERGLGACAENPGAIVQGPTVPARDEWLALRPLERPFAYSIEVPGPDPHHQTCNVFYPRELLERSGGFDAAGFATIQGEDADLAWRCLEAGAGSAFAEGARVEHAFNRLGPLGKLARAASWDLRVYALHPGLRRAAFVRGVFWKGSHYLLVRALAGLLVPRRLAIVRAWLVLPYLVHLAERGRVEGGGLALAPYFAVHDLVELAAAIRSSARYRVPML
jgi:glycosyltransferase involved in cell wall biosynthesis